ncbi:MAG: methyltransferase domain-containing protein [Anaerolineae bacterium]
MKWALIAVGLGVAVALLYWQLVIAEGAYLGAKVVALLYDWSARSYDRIKSFQRRYERWFLGEPLQQALASIPYPLVLDVATGTGRLPRTLFGDADFHGRVIGLDYARNMLHEAVRMTTPWSERVAFVWKDASELPFPDDTFEAVTCLEALEFMPDIERVLRELVRVLRPGGLLLISNRIGKLASFLPGRTYDKGAFEALLRAQGLEMIRIRTWQVDYDLVWARKSGVMQGPFSPRTLADVLRCPQCGEPLLFTPTHAICEQEHAFAIGEDGVIELEHPVEVA